MPIVGGSRQALNHDDFRNLRARPLQRLVSVPNIANGGLVARPAIHDAWQGTAPTSARRACSSSGESNLDRPTAVQPLLPLGPLLTHIEASDHDLSVLAPRSRPRHTAITKA